MKKIVFSLAIIALAAGTLSAATNDGDKGKKKKSCCAANKGCATATPATPAK